MTVWYIWKEETKALLLTQSERKQEKWASGKCSGIYYVIVLVIFTAVLINLKTNFNSHILVDLNYTDV